ncbi:type I restriction enzyme S subunit [Sphaerotilus hippei]|uniref:Type I restriction enzyme S subunit n=1 Tax=Sphaerotilus hippei TaxID=744406 RepID=A0A318H446_9BURK|nr:restriction endonuclease subunit S [Sphaerotilus hippei]PXW95890.1 type I restriction enzyme S subunit [Sphaerotilus hippei]
MSFPTYAHYKDSGVEWLGEVPAHWDSLRFSRAILAIKDGTHGTFARTSDGLPLLSAKNVSNGLIETTSAESLISVADHDAIVDNGFPVRGDILLTIVGTIGRVCVYPFDHPIAFQRSVCFVRLSRGYRPTFFFYLIQSKFFQEQLQSRSKSSAQAGIYMGDVCATHLACPPSEIEQDCIATFLDHETTKLDALIAEQRTLIDLLKEKRQAVISHAVTKGLDPRVPMKDSGVEWLGEVPAHWETKRIKHLVESFEQGWSPQCEGYPVESDTEWGVLKVGCVNGGKFRREENKVLPMDIEPIPSLGICAGDLLISRANTRELVGSAAVADQNYSNLLLCDKLYRIKLKQQDCDPQFLGMYLGTASARGRIELSATGASSSMVNIGQSAILEMQLSLPPYGEQLQITSFLREETIRLGALTDEAQTTIALLQERRSALISAAVTGKIDVRQHTTEAA